jgi:hypothetical protein
MLIGESRQSVAGHVDRTLGRIGLPHRGRFFRKGAERVAKTTSDIIIERLLEWGVDTYYGLPGDGINGFFESMRQHRDQIRFVHVRHEEVASLAAVGHAKFTGKPAVCISTAGPGRSSRSRV